MRSIAIVGMGTMGTAIHGRLAEGYEVTAIAHGDDLAMVRHAEVVILAVKPQSFPELAQQLWPHISKQLVISILAGVSTQALTERLGTEQVVRTMPNLAVRMGQSLTAWYTGQSINTDDTETMLNCWGESLRLSDEDQFHAFTALAGSGPAYFYELAGALQASATNYGFTPEQSRHIAVQTLLGAASVIDRNSSPDELVQRVASKGGTTEAALATFDQLGFGAVVQQGVEAARERSRALSDLV